MALSVLIKPSGAACNLRCRYCFYLPDNHTAANMGIADIDALVKALMEYEKHELWILFQGGEPLIAGIDFYEQFVKTINKYRGDCRINYSIQTNATLIDRAWCKFFKTNNVLVGVSLDGTKYLNDKNRVNTKGESSFAAVMKAIKLLDSTGVEYNILSVITKDLCMFRDEALKFFFERFKYLQFTMPIKESWNVDILPTDAQMFDFLDAAFKDYSKRILTGNYVSVRYFDNLINIASGKPSEQCGLDGKCMGYLLIDSDLSCYPCDFYVSSENRIGKIGVDKVKDMLESTAMQRFKKEIELSAVCRECQAYELCRVGCKRYRDDGVHYYCNAIKCFLIKNESAIHSIAFKILS